MAVWVAPAAMEAQDSRPQVQLSVDDRITEVGEEVTITWSVGGADSVSVRRDDTQLSTDHQGEWKETIARKGVIQWVVTATNRSGSVSEELEIEAVSIGSIESFVKATSQYPAAGRATSSGPVSPRRRKLYPPAGPGSGPR